MGDNKQPNEPDASERPQPRVSEGAKLAAAWLAIAGSVSDREVRSKVISRYVSSSTISEIAAALPQLAEHRVGVVAFAGTAFLQVTLTTDAEAARLPEFAPT